MVSLLRLRFSPAALGGVLIFITDRCNARCSHCFYWPNLENPAPEMNLEDCRRMGEGLRPVHKLMLSGGEPFLREDIAEAAGELMLGSGARRLDIATNGTLPQRIISMSRKFCADFPDRQLNISVSIDGPKEIHNEIRGGDCFDAAMESLGALVELSRTMPNLLPSAVLTLSRYNEAVAESALRWLSGRGVPHLDVALARGTGRSGEILAPDADTARDVFAFLDGPGRSRWQGRLGAALARHRRGLQLAMLEGRGPRLKCCAAAKFASITPSADVFPCPAYRQPLGNLRQSGWDIRAILSGEKARAAREAIQSGACMCAMECAMDWSIFYDWRSDLAVLGRAFSRGRT